MQKEDLYMLELFLIGAFVGCGLTLLTIFSEFRVLSKQWWKNRCEEKAAFDASFHEALAVNARLWVALAASKAAVTVEASVQKRGHEHDFACEAATECASPSEFNSSLITSTTRT